MRHPSPRKRFSPQRLAVRLASLFALVTLLAVVLVGAVVYERQKRELEDAVGTRLLNIARIGALFVDPGLHAEAQASGRQDSDAYGRVRRWLATIRTEAVLPTPIYTLAFDGAQARLVVTSDGAQASGAAVAGQGPFRHYHAAVHPRDPGGGWPMGATGG